VLYEDAVIQIGVKTECRSNLARLALFYGNKTAYPFLVSFYCLLWSSRLVIGLMAIFRPFLTFWLNRVDWQRTCLNNNLTSITIHYNCADLRSFKSFSFFQNFQPIVTSSAELQPCITLQVLCLKKIIFHMYFKFGFSGFVSYSGFLDVNISLVMFLPTPFCKNSKLPNRNISFG
jgi:hypothetical protein